MALAITELTSNYDNVDRTTFYSVASTSPAANSFLALLYTSREATTAPGMTPDAVFSGSWTETMPEQVDGISALGCWTMQLGASPGTAGFNLNVDGGVTCLGCLWHLLQITGHDTSGTVVQGINGPTGTTSGTAGLSAAAPSLGNANNAQIFYSHHRGNSATTPEGGWTGATDRFGGTPNMGARAQWTIGAADLSPTATFTSVRWQSLYLEIKVAGAAPAVDPYKWRRHRIGLVVPR